MTQADLDDLPTTLAIGVAASVLQFVVHESIGHGLACLAVGGRILAVAPLWMQCSVSDRLMALAGPAANALAGALCWAVLRWLPPENAAPRLFLWLSIAFHWLVAAGYLAVGAASGFGDWPAILPVLLGTWPGRLATIAVAAGGYLFALRTLAGLGVRRLGVSLLHEQRLRRLALAPALAAAVVAVMAELIGGRLQPLGLALALGCTAVVGWSLLAVPRFVAPAATAPDVVVKRSPGWILVGAAAAIGFIAIVGPAPGMQ